MFGLGITLAYLVKFYQTALSVKLPIIGKREKSSQVKSQRSDRKVDSVLLGMKKKEKKIKRKWNSNKKWKNKNVFKKEK